jgi:hypothetical protein
MLVGLGSALIAAVLFGAGSIVQAIAARNVPISAGASHRLVVGLLRQPVFLASVALNLSGFVFHLIALRTIPLDVGDAQEGDGFVLGVIVALAVIAGSAVVASRYDGAEATAVLGLMAGFGFAGVSVCARVLPDLEPSTVVGSPATYALGLSGGLAFLIYSLALQRGTVTGATGPMIVTQTVTPAMIGVLWLGDNIRPGWTAPAIVSFAVTAVGAVALARFERAPDHRAVPFDDVASSPTEP